MTTPIEMELKNNMAWLYHAAWIVAGLVMAAATVAFADHLPLWEMRVGGAVSEIPHYRGSRHSESYIIPVPYFIFRGERFRLSDEGARQLLLDTDRLRLEVSVAAGLPAPAGANPERDGMPRLEPTLEVGPALDINFWRSEDRRDALWLRLPVRATISIDDWSPRYEGLNLPPYFQFKVRRGTFEHGISAGPIFADRHYHEYFYEVPAQFATPLRPEYHPGSGYSGLRLTVSLTHRIDRQWFGCYLRFDWLDQARFQDSPLVVTDHYTALGCGATWRVLSSREPAKHESWTGN